MTTFTFQNWFKNSSIDSIGFSIVKRAMDFTNRLARGFFCLLLFCQTNAWAQFAGSGTSELPLFWILGPWLALAAVIFTARRLPAWTRALVYRTVKRAAVIYVALEAGLFVTILALRMLFDVGINVLSLVEVLWLLGFFFSGIVICILFLVIGCWELIARLYIR